MLKELREKCMSFSKKEITKAIKPDQRVIQVSGAIEDLNVVLSKLLKRLRDWSMLYEPELSKAIFEQEDFVKAMKNPEQARKQYKVKKTFGAELEEEALAFEALRSQIEVLYALRKTQEEELEKLVLTQFPNMSSLAGPSIVARLLRQAGSLKQLSRMPASTIQVLGAEKALFRHLRSGAKPPKYGILFSSPYVQQAKDKGKGARTLADKLAIAAKVDYFKGEFVGDVLQEQL